MTARPTAASRTVPARMWAAITEDAPPLIEEVAHYKPHLKRQDLRHIRVMVTPDLPKRRKPQP